MIDWEMDDWNGNQVPEIEALADEIAAVVNRSNTEPWAPEAEVIAREAVATALYNSKILRDVLKMLEDYKNEEAA